MGQSHVGRRRVHGPSLVVRVRDGVSHGWSDASRLSGIICRGGLSANVRVNRRGRNLGGILRLIRVGLVVRWRGPVGGGDLRGLKSCVGDNPRGVRRPVRSCRCCRNHCSLLSLHVSGGSSGGGGGCVRSLKGK